MPFAKLMIHAMWGTKNRFPFLQKTVRPEVYKHIIDNVKIKSLYIDCLNGAEDHIHILMGLNADVSISKTIQLLKGESFFGLTNNH